ncbi:MAG: hypothetical protein WC761_05115 [Candidatus Paceibacterota bacterium]|jgi:hypothetical protein
MFRTNSRKRGFIKAIILIIIALALLKYFYNLTFFDILKSDVVTDIWAIIKSIFGIIWDLLTVMLDFLKQMVGVAQNSVESLKN